MERSTTKEGTLMKGSLLRAATLAALVLGAVAVPGSALAAPPANDEFANAAVIDASTLPVTVNAVIDEATTESGEPIPCSSVNQSAWYVLTPTTTAVLRLTKSSTTFYGLLNVYRQTGAGIGGLSPVACSPYWDSNPVTFTPQAGHTYYLQTGTGFSSAGSVGLTLEVVPPPANDDFASASSVGGIPFSEVVDSSAATVEVGEPLPSCSYAGAPTGTVWYRYTPAADGWVTVDTLGSYPTTVFAAYEGGTLGSLSELACRVQYGKLTVRVTAAQEVRFLVGSLFGVRGRIAFNLATTPELAMNWGWNVFQPSVFDTLQFSDFSYDPGEVGISSRQWDFGDGTSSTEASPQHRYAADG